MPHQQHFVRNVICLVLGIVSPACCPESTPGLSPNSRLRLATTSSVENTGLLQAILPPFEKRTGISVQVLAVGTGQALKLAANGDADAVLVHDREAEERFLAEGQGVNRRVVMVNDFVLVGPKDDPAKLRGLATATAAFRRLSEAQAPFVSRGDDSGTHKAEMRLWRATGAEPKGDWYVEAGQGMRQTLEMAFEKSAYCLTDRATFLAAAKQLELEVLVAGDPVFRNEYSIIPANPAKHPEAHYLESMTLVGWLTSREGQALIGAFQSGGQTLFHPEAVPAR